MTAHRTRHGSYDTDALDEFNRGTERARDAYDREPCSIAIDHRCHRCRNRQHSACGGKAVVDGHFEPCACPDEAHWVSERRTDAGTPR